MFRKAAAANAAHTLPAIDTTEARQRLAQVAAERAKVQAVIISAEHQRDSVTKEISRRRSHEPVDRGRVAEARSAARSIA